MATPTFSAKLPDVTLQQLTDLASQFGVSKSQIVIQAIRQLYQQEIKTMNTQDMLDKMMQPNYDALNEKDDRPMSSGPFLGWSSPDEPSLPYHINEEMMGSEATEASARLMADLLREHGHDVEYGFRINRDEPPFDDAEWQECLDLISKM